MAEMSPYKPPPNSYLLPARALHDGTVSCMSALTATEARLEHLEAHALTCNEPPLQPCGLCVGIRQAYFDMMVEAATVQMYGFSRNSGGGLDGPFDRRQEPSPGTDDVVLRTLQLPNGQPWAQLAVLDESVPDLSAIMSLLDRMQFGGQPVYWLKPLTPQSPGQGQAPPPTEPTE